MHYIALHYIALHCITLHYITLHTYIHTCTYVHTHIYVRMYTYILYTLYCMIICEKRGGRLELVSLGASHISNMQQIPCCLLGERLDHTHCLNCVQYRQSWTDLPLVGMQRRIWKWKWSLIIISSLLMTLMIITLMSVLHNSNACTLQILTDPYRSFCHFWTSCSHIDRPSALPAEWCCIQVPWHLTPVRSVRFVHVCSTGWIPWTEAASENALRW